MNLKKKHCARGFFLCLGVTALVVARLSVSVGRMIWAMKTGQSITGGGELPTWASLFFGDPFFYIGIAALLGTVMFRIFWKKAK